MQWVEVNIFYHYFMQNLFIYILVTLLCVFALLSVLLCNSSTNVIFNSPGCPEILQAILIIIAAFFKWKFVMS